MSLLQPYYDQFAKILPDHSRNLYVFYIFLAYKERLDFSNAEENTINSFFGHKHGKIINKSIAKSFYFHIKVLFEKNKNSHKYWSIVNSHAEDIGILYVLEQDPEETKYDEFSDDSIEDNTESNDDDEYDSDTSSKLVSHFKSFLENPSVINEIARKIFQNCELLNPKIVHNNDPLCSGIIYSERLKKTHYRLYKLLEDDNLMANIETPEKVIEYSVLPLIEELMAYTSIPEGLSFKGNDFGILKLYEKFNYVWYSSSYQSKSDNISEKTYSNDIAFNIIDLSLANLNEIEKRYDGVSCQSSRKRNSSEGPTKYPDFYAYFENQKYNHFYEFFFCEISYGPFTHQEKHTKNDFIKLFKYAADSLNHDYSFLTEFKDFDEIFDLYKRIKICLFHFYDTKLDIYTVSREFWPLAKMDKIFQIEIPLIQNNKRKMLIKELSKIIKILEYINRDILINNFNLIEKIDKWVTDNEKDSNSEKYRFIKTINSPNHF